MRRKNKGVMLIMLLQISFISAQNQNISLIFTSVNGQYLETDSVLIENLTQACDTVLYYPDTVLFLDVATSTSNHAGGKMKHTGFLYWNPPNTNATNSSGFTGLPAGGRNNDGTFDFIRNYGCFRTSTEWNFNTDHAWYRWLHNADQTPRLAPIITINSRVVSASDA